MPAIMPSTEPALRHRSRARPRHSIGGPVATGPATISPSGPAGTGERASGRSPRPMQPATTPAATTATTITTGSGKRRRSSPRRRVGAVDVVTTASCSRGGPTGSPAIPGPRSGKSPTRPPVTLCYCRAMDQRLRDRASIVIAGVGVILSLVVVLFARFDPGVVLTTSGPYVIVDDVAPRSIAAQHGLRRGMVVLDLQGVTLVQMPQYVEPGIEPTPD